MTTDNQTNIGMEDLFSWNHKTTKKHLEDISAIYTDFEV